MLSPFNIETTFRRAKFFKAYILQSDQHVRHASTPFVRKKRKQTKNVLKIIHFSNYYFSWQALKRSETGTKIFYTVLPKTGGILCLFFKSTFNL